MEHNPAMDQQPTDAVEPKLPSLPTHGRRTGLRFALGTTITGLVVAGCEVLSGLGIPVGPKASEPPSPTPSGIEQQSNSPIPTPISSETPTIIIPTASPTQEATPTLSPEQQLQKTFDHWLDPTTPLPDLTRFYFSDSSKTPALANMLAQPGGSFNSILKDPTVSHSVPFEGLPIALSEVKASNGKSYVIVYELQESAKDKNGVSQRYIFPVNYGPLGTTKIGVLTTAAGVEYGSLTQRAISGRYPITTIEKAIQREIGKDFMEFNVSYINSKDIPLYEATRDPQEITAQNPTARAVLLDSWQLLNNPFGKVTLSSAFKKIINNPVVDGFNLADIPMCVNTATQDTPDLS